MFCWTLREEGSSFSSSAGSEGVNLNRRASVRRDSTHACVYYIMPSDSGFRAHATLARCCRCSAKKFKPTISIIGTSCLVRPAQPPMSNLLIERVLTVLAKSSRPRAFPELCSRSTIKPVPEREQALTGVNPEFEKLAISASVGKDRIRARGRNPLVAFFGRPAEDSAGVERSGDLRIVVSPQHQTNSR